MPPQLPITPPSAHPPSRFTPSNNTAAPSPSHPYSVASRARSGTLISLGSTHSDSPSTPLDARDAPLSEEPDPPRASTSSSTSASKGQSTLSPDAAKVARPRAASRGGPGNSRIREQQRSLGLTHSHPPGPSGGSTLQLLNPSAAPYSALTPPIDLASDPFSSSRTQHFRSSGAPDDAPNDRDPYGGQAVGSFHTLRTLHHGVAGHASGAGDGMVESPAAARGGRYFDEYDEDEVDRRRGGGGAMSRSSSSSSLMVLGPRVGAGGIRAVPAARPRSASTIIDITPSGSSLRPPGSPSNAKGVTDNRSRSSSLASVASNRSTASGLHVGGTPSAQPSTGRTSTLRQAGSLRGLFLDRPVLRATLQGVGLMLACAVAAGLVVWWVLPPVDGEDREKVRLPTTFEQLKELNQVLQVYKNRHYWRVLVSFCIIYLFLQAFSLPGSMYLSILAGAMYGVVRALPLICLLVSTGALLCYSLSAVIGGPILTHSARWRHRLESWRIRIASRTSSYDLFSYLVILRISPLPPHWVVNLLAPHLGIPRGIFWASTFVGIAGITLIHVQIGTTLDSMAGPDDFNLLSAKNLAGLAAIALAAIIPVGVRWYWKSEIQAVAEDDPEEEEQLNGRGGPGGSSSLTGLNSARTSTSSSSRGLRSSSSTTRLVKDDEISVPATIIDESEEEELLDDGSVLGHASTDGEDEDVRVLGRGEAHPTLGSPIKVVNGVAPTGKAARVLRVQEGTQVPRRSTGAQGGS